MKIIKAILITIISIFILAWFVPSVSYLDYTTLFIAGVVLTLLQKIIRPILNLLFLPINIVTLGLFSIIINIFVLWLATLLVPGFDISQTQALGITLSPFWSLVLISFMLGVVQSFVGKFIK